MLFEKMQEYLASKDTWYINKADERVGLSLISVLNSTNESLAIYSGGLGV